MDKESAALAVAAFYVVFAVVEMARSRFVSPDSTARDVFADGISTLTVPLIIIPTILWLAPTVAESIAPRSEGSLAWLPTWAKIGLLLVGDDLTQYLWHRLSHTHWLYPLHRAHHSARYMSVRIVYRNNLIYYALMPGLWVSGMLVHWGLTNAYVGYAFVKMVVIVAAHSSVPWDEPLYRNRWTAPLMWVVERVISTPSTHAAHHGLSESDGVTYYHGNFGNLLFLWDILFGTAKITRRRPQAFGVEQLEPIPLTRELLIPTPARRSTR
jgi:sterol desaturase/sphingolipid hydroxylase (fatty acid hydroxylase superfamily)